MLINSTANTREHLSMYNYIIDRKSVFCINKILIFQQLLLLLLLEKSIYENQNIIFNAHLLILLFQFLFIIINGRKNYW